MAVRVAGNCENQKPQMIQIHNPVGKRRRIPLTPLIDVIFILVMFFLLSSTFGIWRPLDVALGSGESVGAADNSRTSTAPAVLIVLKMGAGSDIPELIVNGLPVPLGELGSELNRLAAAGAETAVLIPHKATDFQQVVHILDAAKATNMKRVSLKLD